MNTHTVICSDCETEIATWRGGGQNYQKKEEWECTGEKRKKVGKNKVVKIGGRKVKSHLVSCGKVFCGTCARKRKYKCGRYGCKGSLRLERKADGSVPKIRRKARQ